MPPSPPPPGATVAVGKGKAPEGIQLVISDPLETPILSIDETNPADTVEVQAEIAGDHQIIFFNPFRFEAQTVEVSYIVNP